MAGLCWMAVTLAFFLSAENTLAVDQNRLATFVHGILGQYGPEGTFSLAVSIPEDQNRRPTDILKEVYESDPIDKVLEKLNNDQVYIGNRVVAAKVLKQARGAVQAESRVVDHLNDLFNPNNRNDLLLFYDYASPCVDKCTSQTNPENILKRINDLNKWNNYAFVFSKIFKPTNGPYNTEEELSGGLTRFGSKIGLGSKFRCDKKVGRMQCTTCYSNNQVAVACVSDDSQPGPSQSQPQQGSSGTAQGVQSRSGRYRRGIGWSSGTGWALGGERHHESSATPSEGSSLSKTSGVAGDLVLTSGLGRNGGGASLSGGWSLGGESLHSVKWSPNGGGSRSHIKGVAGGLSLSSGLGHNGGGASLSGGWSLGGESLHSASWTPNGGESHSEMKGVAGGLSVSSGLGHNGGGLSASGGWTLGGHGKHSATWSPSGGSASSSTSGIGAGFSHSLSWGRNRRRKRIIIIRVE